MNTITSIFEQAQLSEAAYANFWDAQLFQPLALPEDIKAALLAEQFSEAQAADFVAHWKVVDHVPDLGSGFSATIFEHLDKSGNGTGQFNLAIRGSRQPVDFAADVALIADQGIAVAQLVDLYNFWQRAQAPAGSRYTAAVLASGDSVNYVDSSHLSDVEMRTGSGAFTAAPSSINVSGHSLGGHLAMAFTRLFPDIDANAISVNGLGFKTENNTVNNLFAALNGGSQFDASQIQNVYGINGPEFAAQNTFLLQQVGAYDGIFIESAGLDTHGGHSSSQMTDSLAVYNLFAIIDPSLNVETITDILQAMPVDSDNTLEAALAAVGGVYGQTYPVTETDRNGLYVNLYDLQASLPGQATITSLTDTSTISLQNQATNLAYLYALLNLNPFVIEGVNYNNLNVDGYLDKQTYSEQFIEDRAAFLYYSMPDNTNPDPIRYEQRGENGVAPFVVTDNQQSSSPSNYIFGTKEHDGITGDQNEDHLYGMDFTSWKPTVFQNKKTPLTTISEDVKVTALYF